jgi:DNA-directed RNA polymerase subunit RPC12/RpoP
MNLTSIAVVCPDCDAPLNLAVGQRYAQCASCGAKFVVEHSADEEARLTSFVSLLAQSGDRVPADKAETRLSELELAGIDLEAELEGVRTELQDAKAGYRQQMARSERNVFPVQNWTYMSGLLALGAGFSSLFVLDRPERLAGVAIAGLLSLVTWAFHHEWLDAENRAQIELLPARQTIQEAQDALARVTARIQDCSLERELRQMQLSQPGAEPTE